MREHGPFLLQTPVRRAGLVRILERADGGMLIFGDCCEDAANSRNIWKNRQENETESANMMILSHFLWGKGGREEGGKDMQETSLTAQDWKRQSKQVQADMYALLDRLDGGELEPEASRAAREQLHAMVKQLKRERDAMIGLIAEDTTFIDEMETRLHELDKRAKRKFHLVPPAPTNAQIDYAERKTRHFAQGKSFYKLFWVFFIGCFLGVVVERVWCFVRYGLYEPRVGLIYGPFNLVYGIGAWALTLALYPFRNRGKIFSFIGGALVGSAVEYACSWFQEMVFGSVSWDYSSQPFNLNGRICLLYSIYWGVLGVLWIKELYPRMAKLILKIPNKVGKPLTFVLLAFMVFNTVMTGLTTLRWMERCHGIPADNAVEVYFDEHYPNERMESILSNLVFLEQTESPPSL